VQVTLKHGGHKPLLIKSPVHTARVRRMLKLFPKAKFVFIHRHPLQVGNVDLCARGGVCAGV
jgi:hypothetical protein